MVKRYIWIQGVFRLFENFYYISKEGLVCSKIEVSEEEKVKIVQGKRGFTPITITLETEEEASGLWHILACLDDESLSDYLACMGTGAKEIILRMNYTMFHEYDDVYHPEAT